MHPGGQDVAAATHAMSTCGIPVQISGPASLHTSPHGNDLKPIIDRIADALPGWKAALMARSGHLILVQAVLTAIPIYLLITLDVPKWFIEAIDKWHRSFLWRGRRDLRGHCPVAWQRVTRPRLLGGLGIHDLQTMA